LKVESNTPLSAAIQVLRYALLLMLSRKHATLLGYSKERNPLVFDFGRVHLKVLAPIAYFVPYEVNWIEQCLDHAVKRLGPTFSFDFEFMSFPLEFDWHDIESRSAESVRNALSGVRPLREVLPVVHSKMAAIQDAINVLDRPDPKIGGRRLTDRPRIGRVAYDLKRILKERRELLFDGVNCDKLQGGIKQIQTTLGVQDAHLRKLFQSVLVAIGRGSTKFDGAFIQLTIDQVEAKSELEQIAKQAGNTAFTRFVEHSWQVDDNRFVQSECVCRLYRFATSKESIQQWFDRALMSSTHDVSFQAFERHVGSEVAGNWGPSTVEAEQKLKALLPTKAVS
jgi:hypothetical protein